MSEEEVNAAFEALQRSAMAVMVHVGLLSAIIHRYPPQVRENFVDKVRDLQADLDREIIEFQGFGEAFDGS